MAAEIKKYESIIKKKKNKHDQIVLPGKSKLNGIEVLIYKTLIDSDISHDEFLLINNVLTEFKSMESKNLKAVIIKNGRIVLLSKCAVCNSKNSNFIKEQEGNGLLSSLIVRKPL